MDITPTDLLDRLRATITIDFGGSQTKAAAHFQISGGYLSDILNGRREIGPAIYEALGFERLVTFRPVPAKGRKAS
jgi:hypothetical protein